MDDSKEYIVIVYKPDSDDYCRGCLMSSYESDFNWKVIRSEKEFIEFLTPYYESNLNRGMGEAPYEFHCFLRTKQDEDDWNNYDYIPEHIEKAASEKAIEINNIRIEKARQDREIQKQKDKEYRRKQYLKMKEEFENE